ncbi:MAG TPA: 16S rRNA (adenine(1518)-N(6)/adenine(1519)-N(6))-dimethyltransferase RsmA [Verrucomicrobiae bacterium]|nr:16S rRNA (adenine(1518)-N(6)/adenine(1519)-N(6))-dimethyltransferase RsmA [Verrucomicrobiae bacterium]
MKLSEMRELLTREDIQLTRSLGQNFLHDGNQLRRIVDAGDLSKTDKVLEIGPGLGPLTELLLKEAGEVLAIEKDGRLVEVLGKRFGVKAENSSSRRREEAERSTILQNPPPDVNGHGPLRLLHDDALEFLKREPHDWRDWKLVANLPYSVASPILVELAQGEHSPRRMVATLQLEVARRLMARAGDDDYGLLTLLVQLDFEPRDWFKIPAGCFFPQPDVDSACVILERRTQPFLPEALRRDFHKVVKRAFSQRRKMMMKLLKTEWPAAALARAFAGAGLSPQTRAETVSVEQFVALTSLLR